MDLEIIQNPYIPIGLTDLLNNQQVFSNMQLEIMKKVNSTYLLLKGVKSHRTISWEKIFGLLCMQNWFMHRSPKLTTTSS